MKTYILKTVFILLTFLPLSLHAAIITKTYTEVNPEKHIAVKITYPFITKSNQADKINTEIKHVLTERKKAFVNEISSNTQTPIADLPLTNDSNTLEITFTSYKNTQSILSLRFKIYEMHYGAAHPFSDYKSININMQTGENISLANVMKKPHYLSFLSSYAYPILAKKLSHEAQSSETPFKEGLSPTLDNFSVWNVTTKGLLITFPADQVAAYVFGPQEILIPFGTF